MLALNLNEVVEDRDGCNRETENEKRYYVTYDVCI